MATWIKLEDVLKLLHEEEEITIVTRYGKITYKEAKLNIDQLKSLPELYKEENAKDKHAIAILKSECYCFSLSNISRSIMINQALDRAISALEERCIRNDDTLQSVGGRAENVEQKEENI